jgi:hypothetical protein
MLQHVTLPRHYEHLFLQQPDCFFWKWALWNHLTSGSNRTIRNLFGGRQPLVPLLLQGPPFFLIILLLLTPPFNRDDRHLLAHAMASDFHSHMSVFLLRIKLHMLIRLGVSPPSFDTSAWNGVMGGSCQNLYSLKKFGLAEVWTRVSQMTQQHSIQYAIIH